MKKRNQKARALINQNVGIIEQVKRSGDIHTVQFPSGEWFLCVEEKSQYRSRTTISQGQLEEDLLVSFIDTNGFRKIYHKPFKSQHKALKFRRSLIEEMIEFERKGFDYFDF